MSKNKKNATETPVEKKLSDPQYYFNREFSWLEFNRRVLSEGLDPRTPLLERLKFLGIFSSNLDEYFMVRVAILKKQIEAEVHKLTPDGCTPQEQLDGINQRLLPMVSLQHQFFEETLRPELAKNGIYILNYIDLNKEQKTYLQNYFEEHIFPVLTPLAIDASHPFPYLSNLSFNLAVMLKNPDTQEDLLARIKVPKILPRFLPLPEQLQIKENAKTVNWMGVPLEQVIAHNLGSLFPGMDIQEYHLFRITRDADLAVQEDEGDDLLLVIEKELRKRRIGGTVVRMEINPTMPSKLKKILMERLELSEKDVYTVNGLLDLKDLMSFLGLPLPNLKDPSWGSIMPPRLRNYSDDITTGNLNEKNGIDFFAVIRQKDLLVHHPYHSFASTVQGFITQAAHDPNVLAIKMTLYRTSGDSPIVNALIAGAENGKQVAALVELKARFDEENNIQWARKLERSGVHVVYGLAGLKTHTKIVMVVRQEEGHIRRYVHIGTGNYNPKTAKLYTDLGLLSCRPELGADLADLFNFLTGYSRQQSYRKLLVAPVNMRARFIKLIRREIENCKDGDTGRIVAKMNSLVDPEIIANLYAASQAGVKIDLIIRGICCLRPGLKDMSENIKVVSIIGRYLEHSRIFYFHNKGKEELYIGSADWMPRNLNRRVEAITPVEDPDLTKELQEILGILLSDNRQAWDLQSDGQYIQRRPTDNSPELGSHKILMETVANN
ncbi:MAG: polyphosphate kinase 1 [Trichodesmium sp. MO_231.B1]|nr:polyphosphate kinase 1 [Trichodesmium sp. MO_231.B1]